MASQSLSGDEAIALYQTCGIQGVYDWEGASTDSYLRGTVTVTVIFDFSVLVIREVTKVKTAGI